MNNQLTDTEKPVPRFPLAMGRWIQGRCVTEPHAKALSFELFADWKQWAETNAEFIGTMRRFSDALIARQFKKWRVTGGVRGFKGIGLQEIVRAPSPAHLSTKTQARRCA